MIAEGRALRSALNRRDLIARQLVDADRAVAEAADLYRMKVGYPMKPRLEALRKEVGL